MYHEWNMISAENRLVNPSGKSWIRLLANIIHISRKTVSQQDIEGSLKGNWDAEFGPAAPIPVDGRLAEQPACPSAWQYLPIGPLTFK